MINDKDVIRMKIPYPTINNKLAVEAHMYICKSKNNSYCEFIKCQTLKPQMLLSNLFKHCIDETADETRNPFKTTTRIDCDKLFTTKSVKYDINMRTTIRPDVCDDLFNNAIIELNTDGFSTIPINESELININRLVTNIQ